MNDEIKYVNIYTDGSCLKNPGIGAYCVYYEYFNDENEVIKTATISESFSDTTNNRMELLAVIIGIGNVENNSIPIHLYSDSSYVINSMNLKWIDGWKKTNWINSQKKSVKNKDLWERYLSTKEKLKDITFHWVKGHSGNPGNEYCDKVANGLATQLQNDLNELKENPNV